MCGMCGSRGERRLRIGASASVCGCGLGAGAVWLAVIGELGCIPERDPPSPCWLCPSPWPVFLRCDEPMPAALLA